MGSKDQLDRKSFVALLADVKLRIQTAQTRAMLAVNSELVRLYWDIGRMIDARQKLEGWGSGVIPRLALELKNEMPELKGFSERNIGRMIAFHREYPDPPAILPQAVAKLRSDTSPVSQLTDNEKVAISPQAAAKLEDMRFLQQPAAKLVAQGKAPPVVAQFDDSLLWAIPWAHHVTLMDKVSDLTARRWYMEQTLANGWSRNILAMQIDAQAHARHGKARSNFAGIDKPIGISTYELTRALPKDMKSALPTVEEIEAELSEVVQQAEAKHAPGKRGGTVREPGIEYGHSRPYSITPAMLRCVEEIGKALGRLRVVDGTDPKSDHVTDQVYRAKKPPRRRKGGRYEA